MEIVRPEDVQRARERDWHRQLLLAKQRVSAGHSTPEDLHLLGKAFHTLVGLTQFFLRGNQGVSWASTQLERAEQGIVDPPGIDVLETILGLLELHGPKENPEPAPAPNPPPAPAQSVPGSTPAKARAFPTVSLAPSRARATPVAQAEHYADHIAQCEQHILPGLESARTRGEQEKHLHDLKGVGGSVFPDETPALVQHIWTLDDRAAAIDQLVDTYRVALRSVASGLYNDGRYLVQNLAQSFGLMIARPAAAASAAEAPLNVQVGMRALDELAEFALELTQLLGRIDWLSRRPAEASPSLTRLRSVSTALRERDYAVPNLALPGQRVSGLELHAGSPLGEMAVSVEEAAATLQQELDGLRRERTELRQVADRATRTLSALRAEMVELRTSAWADIAAPFETEIQKIAERQQRKVRFVVEGGATRIEKRFAQLLRSILTHLNSNAICHGVEAVRPPEKDPVATLTLRAETVGFGIVRIVVEDDGGGIDLDQVRRRAAEKGLAVPPNCTRWEDVTDPHEILRCLFENEFTTRSVGDQDSGKGIGLAQVRERVEAVRGEILIETKLGVFTRFVLQLPVHHDVLEVIPVEIGGSPYFLPASLVISQGPCPPLPPWEGGLHALFQLDEGEGRTIDVLPLDRALGLPPSAENELLRLTDGPALTVSKVLGGSRPVAVRSLDPVCAVDPWVGSSLYDDGRIALLLSVPKLERMRVQGLLPLRVHRELGAQRATERACVLVVDDMYPVREAVKKAVEHLGHEAVLADDGLQAWQMFDADPLRFRLIVTDLEMPRMHGYDLITAIRQSRAPSVPIFVLTARSAGIHREQARARGATRLLTKPLLQAELRATLRTLLSA